MENLSLDAREILSVLNEMGYRNITTLQLKEFTKDLRKLIKYEKQLGLLNCPEVIARDPFAELHQAATASSAAKTVKAKTAEALIKPKTVTQPVKKINKPIKTNNPTDSIKVPEAQAPIAGKTQKRLPLHKSSQDISRHTANRMWIRPKSACAPVHLKDNDPVKLYQYYKNEWEKYRNQLPGENNHAELRWKIRSKLLGCEK